MSNRNREANESSLVYTLNFSFRQLMKNINTATPGIVESYQPTVKRAVVRPALRLVKTDGTQIDRAPIANVPVLQPSAGGFMVNLPITPGDAVMLLFSQRGLAAFKKTYQNSTPTASSFFSSTDAVALPGFGGLNVRPATTQGVSVQSENGVDFVSVERGRVTVKTPGAVSIDCGTLDIKASGNINIRGARIGLNDP